eukprot:scaffold80839_cov19-Tisochrysis_lutea.AAC.1
MCVSLTAGVIASTEKRGKPTRTKIFEPHLTFPCYPQVTGVIAMDHRGIITKPACCVLHPSGLVYQSVCVWPLKSFWSMGVSSQSPCAVSSTP